MKRFVLGIALIAVAFVGANEIEGAQNKFGPPMFGLDDEWFFSCDHQSIISLIAENCTEPKWRPMGIDIR